MSSVGYGFNVCSVFAAISPAACETAKKSLDLTTLEGRVLVAFFGRMLCGQMDVEDAQPIKFDDEAVAKIVLQEICSIAPRDFCFLPLKDTIIITTSLSQKKSTPTFKHGKTTRQKNKKKNNFLFFIYMRRIIFL